VTFTVDDLLRVRVGVTNLMTTYQYLADTGKVERLAQLFAPDGVLRPAPRSSPGQPKCSVYSPAPAASSSTPTSCPRVIT